MIASESLRNQMRVVVGATFPRFAPREIKGCDTNDLPSSVLVCLKRGAEDAAKHYPEGQGKHAFELLATRSIDSFGWTFVFKAAENKNVAYIIEADLPP
jgi:hypothetical protein